ncbi:vacuolar protein sorting-associated protein 60.2-like [Tasmannia lanceolata]|uniref:vacuolar protein sorting-associated protein 60.2-like n=1 Tax=Tasmannia lanceolata TaxID=3420 RepID=UPI004062E78C
MSHVVGKNRKELLAMAKVHGEGKKETFHGFDAISFNAGPILEDRCIFVRKIHTSENSNDMLTKTVKEEKLYLLDVLSGEIGTLMGLLKALANFFFCKRKPVEFFYSVPDDIDEDDLMGELDALEADMGTEIEHDGMPSYLEPDLEAELNLPSAPSGNAAMPPGRYNAQAEDELGLPAVPQASIRG